MKHPVNFRLNNQAFATVSVLAEELETTKTRIIENAVDFYARKMMGKKRNLLQSAGSLDEEDADRMLGSIYSSRRNKNLKVRL